MDFELWVCVDACGAVDLVEGVLFLLMLGGGSFFQDDGGF